MQSNYQLTDFQIIQQLGRGAYADVVLALHKAENQMYALKAINKKFIAKE